MEKEDDIDKTIRELSNGVCKMVDNVVDQYLSITVDEVLNNVYGDPKDAEKRQELKEALCKRFKNDYGMKLTMKALENENRRYTKTDK